MNRTRYILCMTILNFAVCASLIAQQANVKAVRLRAGETADLWLGVNVSGKVSYALRSRDKTNTVHMWWILEPTGRVKQLGKRANDGTLDIPGLLKGSVSAKLRASATVDTVVYIGENVSVDHSLTFNW